MTQELVTTATERAEKKKKVELALDYIMGLSPDDIAKKWEISTDTVEEELDDIRFSMAKKSSQQKIKLYQTKMQELEAIRQKTIEIADNPEAKDMDKISALRLGKDIIKDEIKYALDLNAVESLEDEVGRNMKHKIEQKMYFIAPEIRVQLLQTYKQQKLSPLAEPTSVPPWRLRNVLFSEEDR